MLRISITSLLAFTTAGVLAQADPSMVAHPYGESRPIENQYIVVFKGDVAQPAALAAQLTQRHGGQVIHTYRNALKGFAVRLPSAAVTALSNNPNVDYVEQDATVSLNETLLSPTQQQGGATWGLDRIDQPALELSGAYNYQYTGAGVYAFVIDTGILSSHADFGGRVAAGYTAVTDGGGTTDCNGHGTHVSGTVGGNTYGVAKGVTLVPVRVLGCSGSGTNSGVIAGIDWVAGQTSMRPAVANMSLGGSKSSSLNASVAGAVSKGVTMVVAAGNSNANACRYSPASEPTAITVGATTSSDARASYSNFGSCLDIFAPGSSIMSDWYGSTTDTNTISGTSMASPHVAGVAALTLAANPSASPAAVADFLIANASLGVVTSAGTGSPNRLVFSLADGAPTNPVSKTVAVSSISGQGLKSGKKWRASATVTIKQYDGSNFSNGVSGATVTGSFAPGGSASCVTETMGTCTLTSASISPAYSMSTFTVVNVSGAYLTYDGSNNFVSSITVPRP